MAPRPGRRRVPARRRGRRDRAASDGTDPPAPPPPPERLTAAAGWAFPSGHTTSATVAAGILVVLLWPLLPSGRARAVLTAVAGLWAGLVGISRVALVAHWPTDVLGGWLLAGSVLTVLAIVLRPRPRDAVRPRPSGPPPGAAPPGVR
ncbi:phosphatase PAP2 family protein [Dactylosporangium sp. CA-052675]|uniref:phosphatase PAP2 family protein n=1 Tax=Dactylosporangium sp. CA-052675 TaxID=3239927 RepID=UPI003D94A775